MHALVLLGRICNVDFSAIRTKELFDSLSCLMMLMEDVVMMRWVINCHRRIDRRGIFRTLSNAI